MPLKKAGGLFVDEFLSEKEQIEEIRSWWRENGWYLIGGAILGISALLGWNRYGAYQDVQAESASALYVELRQAAADDAPGDARTLLAQLRESHPSSPYTDQAGLLVAVLRMRAGQMNGAADELRYVVDGTQDPELALIARLRLARILLHQELFDEALAVLDVDPGSFSARYNEVRGDIYVATGNSVSAQMAYNAALTAQESDLVDRNLVQMKLEDLPIAEVVTTEETTQ
jgi:predicted negative regulator of RcsB-dependent stress response